MSDDKKVKNDAIEILLQSATVVKKEIIAYVKSLCILNYLNNENCVRTIDFIEQVFYDELQV